MKQVHPVPESERWESYRGEVFKLPFQLLNDQAPLVRLLQSCSLRFDDSSAARQYKQFEPQGLSAVLVGSATRLVLHTWPELGVATLDVSAKAEFARALFLECLAALREERVGCCASTG